MLVEIRKPLKKKIEIQTTNENIWNDLPCGVLTNIFSYLGAKSLCKVSMVNKFWRKSSLDPLIWKILSHKLFIKDSHLSTFTNITSFMELSNYKKTIIQKQYDKHVKNSKFLLKLIRFQYFSFLWQDVDFIKNFSIQCYEKKLFNLFIIHFLFETPSELVEKVFQNITILDKISKEDFQIPLLFKKLNKIIKRQPTSKSSLLMIIFKFKNILSSNNFNHEDRNSFEFLLNESEIID